LDGGSNNKGVKEIKFDLHLNEGIIDVKHEKLKCFIKKIIDI
jgi:hypothetical protein